MFVMFIIVIFNLFLGQSKLDYLNTKYINFITMHTWTWCPWERDGVALNIAIACALL